MEEENEVVFASAPKRPRFKRKAITNNSPGTKKKFKKITNCSRAKAMVAATEDEAAALALLQLSDNAVTLKDNATCSQNKTGNADPATVATAATSGGANPTAATSAESAESIAETQKIRAYLGLAIPRLKKNAETAKAVDRFRTSTLPYATLTRLVQFQSSLKSHREIKRPTKHIRALAIYVKEELKLVDEMHALEQEVMAYLPADCPSKAQFAQQVVLY